MSWCWNCCLTADCKNPARLPEQVDVSLDEFIDSILGSVDEELESPEIVIDVLLHGQLERFSLDPRLTARAIQNLLRNAMRYCEKNGFRSVCRCAPRAVRSGWMTMASVFRRKSGSGFSSRFIGWIVVGIAPLADSG